MGSATSGKSWKEIEKLVYGEGKNFTKIAFDNAKDQKRIEKKLRQEFATSFKKGESFDQLVERVRKVTGKESSDAKRIARTEGTRIENMARQQAADDYAEETGNRPKKRWFCTFHNSRDSHIAMHNQTVFEDEPFLTPSGEEMMYPGDDTNVGPEEIINCRCRMVVIPPRGE